jgi:DNA-binding GntR family transcriptional regulator
MAAAKPSTPRLSPQVLAGLIRAQVISGHYAPGQRLTEDALADEHGVSRIPVREAFRLLEADGFVRAQAYYGTFVAELSPEEAADLLEIRGVLEPLGAARAASRRTPEQLAAMKDVVQQGLAAGEAGRIDELPALNTRFHGLLAVASGNTSLNQLISQLRHKIAWVYSVNLPRRAGDSWNEHQMITEAIERQDAESASALMLAHVRRAETAYQLRSAVTEAP